VKRAILGLSTAFIYLISPVGAGAQPEVPEAAFVPGVVGHPQTRALSCEARSAADLAAFWGVMVDEEVLFAALPRSDNPYEGFLGPVDDAPGSLPPRGYGVYAPPVANALRRHGLDAASHRWLGVRGLKRELAAGHPVIVWATYDMVRPGIGSWTAADGTVSIIVRWEHTYIAVGYDPGGVYLVDAYDGETRYHTFSQFIPAWMQLNEMAVTVAGPLPRATYPWRSLRGAGAGAWWSGGRSLLGPH
jgi:uncharacterized protein YvpB